ncbi:hypothetical protein CVT26_009112 [Gymnopilus dilepis]|uniref:Uncharacterized protein n=1 Tax=Gymnopilus dilepis TaxID=231916 RepID=A0A409Y9C1_9AGAR|nr:hypothetical protein CVT26_009112 [Gymnopilus dilepis]
MDKAFWDVLLSGNRNVNHGRILKCAGATVYDFDNMSKLSAFTSNKVRNPLSPRPVMLVTCVGQRVEGPISAFETTQLVHPCYASRVMRGILNPPVYEDLDARNGCFPTCPGQEVIPNFAINTVSSPFALATPTSAHSLSFNRSTSDSSTPSSDSSGSFSSATNSARPFINIASHQSASPNNLQNLATPLPDLFSQTRVASTPSGREAHPAIIVPSRQWKSDITASEWSNSLEEAQRQASRESDAVTDREALRIVARNEQVAGQALYQAFVARFAGQDPEQLPCIVNFDYERLALGGAHVVIGEATGNGVFRATYQEAMNFMAADQMLWRPQDPVKGLVSWNVRPGISTYEGRLARARAAGALIAHGFVWFQLSFAPISFFLSCYAATTFEALKDIKLIRSMDADLADILSAWPLDHDEPLNLHFGDPAASTILCNYLNTNNTNLQNLTTEERSAYDNKVYAMALFGTPYQDFIINPEISAFKEAFNLQLFPDVRLCDTFGPEPLDLLSRMQGGRLLSASNLIEHLTFYRALNDSQLNDDEAELFKIKLCRYLRGIGHPVHPRLPDGLITPEMRATVADDPLYRANTFLRLATGSTSVPTTTPWTIVIRFSIEPPFGHRYYPPPGNSSDGVSWSPMYTPFIFQTCSSLATVCIGDGHFIKDLLKVEDPIDDDSLASDFDAWVHQALLPSSDDWNTT